MAKCLDEGVDPTQMCQSLVERVNRSEVLKSIVEPELLGLFEDWLEELENEVQALLKVHDGLDEDTLARELGLSHRGARFLLSKLAQEG